MAITDAYVTGQEYRAVAEHSTTPDPGLDLLIQPHLIACTRLFERETGQFFGRDDAPVARVFRAKWSDRLELTYEGNCPGIATIDSPNVPLIKVDTDGDGSFADETAWSVGDYELQPLQAAQGPEPQPWTSICIPRWSSKHFVPGNLVQVTAIFGWPAVPEAVKADIIELCRLWRRESPGATGRINELDQLVTESPLVRGLVYRMRDAYLGQVTF